ncbi:hypothetical protein [Empedobacter tilapiae]|uniref:hypothetical protein n=1 Tax=Empedobacter tilapiae TaxID=2491114 RepID=UPI0028D82902|nr:hypothetical protein [Empedobacter tilapiae]
MTKKEQVQKLKRLKSTIEEMIALNQLQHQQLITQLSDINKDLEDLEALPKTSKVIDPNFRLKIRAQILGKQKPLL